jgi:Ser/Thr protein kinase RdoA (MazF antagonist)
MEDQTQLPSGVLTAYGLSDAATEPFGHGLINQTWLVRSADHEFILQRVNSMFPPAINHDIDVVTRHLEAKGQITCRLIPTVNGALWAESGADIWRLLSRVEGISRNALTSANEAREAGAVLARFHAAVGDLEHHFANLRLGIHDTARHLHFLEATLADQSHHPQYAAVAPLGRQILDIANNLPRLPEVSDRVVHGDPKVNNIIYSAESNAALCLIDLDTISRMPLPLELGDAMRSWCNPRSEDHLIGEFSVELFEPSIEGYADGSRDWIIRDEWTAIVPATEIILVELAARFCADALNENYFGWDPQKFSSRSEHNQVRAAGQLNEVRSLVAQKQELNAIVAKVF